MAVTPILQFGTSRFLQAHADLFVSQAMAQGQAVGPIAVVHSSGDASRAHRLAALAAPGGFLVQVRGLQDGVPVQQNVQVTSVRRALSAATGWDAVLALAATDVQIVLSNTGDAGFAPQPADSGRFYDPAMSYPAKLLHLLQARFAAGAAPVQVMPLELIAANGAVLRARVMALAAGLPHGLRDYLAEGVIWTNSLVDRIVSQPLEPAGAVAEPYALWAIAAQPGLVVPCLHPAVQVVEDLGRIEALKLFVLNLGHTVMVQDWLAHGAQGRPLVRDVMADAVARAALLALYESEVLPGFAAAGMEPEARAYLAVTLDRFANPFLDHQIADIAQNHSQKIGLRIAAFLEWSARHGDPGPKPLLRKIVAG